MEEQRRRRHASEPQRISARRLRAGCFRGAPPPRLLRARLAPLQTTPCRPPRRRRCPRAPRLGNCQTSSRRSPRGACGSGPSCRPGPRSTWPRLPGPRQAGACARAENSSRRPPPPCPSRHPRMHRRHRRRDARACPPGPPRASCPCTPAEPARPVRRCVPHRSAAAAASPGPRRAPAQRRAGGARARCCRRRCSRRCAPGTAPASQPGPSRHQPAVRAGAAAGRVGIAHTGPVAGARARAAPHEHTHPPVPGTASRRR